MTRNPDQDRAQRRVHIHMGRTMRGVALALAVAAPAVWTAGCRVHVDKGAHGEDKSVQMDTPFGGIHVNTDQTTAIDLGLPVYPGAELIKGDDSHKSADVRMGFGQWQLRVRAVTYGTADKQDQVLAYYKKALGRYGDVLTCQGNQAVGSPGVTSEGLTCNDNKNVHGDIGDFHTGDGDLELKAGSERHQHIVGFEKQSYGQTRFALVALDLPTNVSDSGKTD
jgi:hypothetical protein